jgi:hypothetical protein
METIKRGDWVEVSWDAALRHEFWEWNGHSTPLGPYVVTRVGESFLEAYDEDDRRHVFAKRFFTKTQLFVKPGDVITISHGAKPYVVIGNGMNGDAIALNALETIRIPAQNIRNVRFVGAVG